MEKTPTLGIGNVDGASNSAEKLMPKPIDVSALDPQRYTLPDAVLKENLPECILAPPQLQLDLGHATHVPAQRYQELYQRFCFARTYIARLYPEHREMMENDRLHTRLEVEGIPLDFSDEEEDDDDEASSDDAPPPPSSSVRQAAAGPSRRRP
ncbi:hypothetical protein JCGZ_24244 [Jatropha curcas]|uniref:Uncharacterized protein n=1 Tax=Jatropha curcas TaxID=180498 RepID=A0A067K034_JATCU|nr:hypothetical protein JCGZ_24244 [Jatropha curcas]